MWKGYEQAGLDPHTSEVVTLQLGNGDVQYLLDCRFIKKVQIKRLLEKVRTKKVVGQNIKFDYKMLRSN